MSLILDALKKLEREKAASRGGSVDIVPAITSSRSTRPRSANWKLALAITGLIAATAAVTAAVVICLAPRGTLTASPASVNEESKGHVSRFPQPGVPADAKVIPSPAADRQTAEAAVVRSSTPFRSSPVESGRTSLRPKETKPILENNEDSFRSSGVTVSNLKVSGIAWQDDRADRRAVVNGALVGEGAMVEGAKIVRILQDRVRFSRSGETFEITVAVSPPMK